MPDVDNIFIYRVMQIVKYYTCFFLFSPKKNIKFGYLNWEFLLFDYLHSNQSTLKLSNPLLVTHYPKAIK